LVARSKKLYLPSCKKQTKDRALPAADNSDDGGDDDDAEAKSELSGESRERFFDFTRQEGSEQHPGRRQVAALQLARSSSATRNRINSESDE